ncbi:MAG: AzlD domain-containing protein [Oscillospiraceae bacterium]|nr:AzlD domain-containing protein [Oscillospiraceae bacterium]
MNVGRLILYIAGMSVTTYLIRAVPLAAVRKKISSRFLRSFLYYIPYAVLSAMVFPAILYATSSVLSAAVGCAAAVICALAGLQLLPVALISCAAVYVTELIVGLV